MLPTATGSPTETNHAATEDDCLRTSPRCADEGLDVGQVWAFYDSVPVWDEHGDTTIGEVERLREFYTLLGLSGASRAWAHEETRISPYASWCVLITDAHTGQVRLRSQRFPRDLTAAGYRRIL